jgi:hypothetical protein
LPANDGVSSAEAASKIAIFGNGRFRACGPQRLCLDYLAGFSRLPIAPGFSRRVGKKKSGQARFSAASRKGFSRSCFLPAAMSFRRSTSLENYGQYMEIVQDDESDDSTNPFEMIDDQ